MGLDMYLQKRNKATGEMIDEEVAYWRKANQIRQWFVKNTGYPENANCTLHTLTKEQLRQLLADCKKVLEDNSLAPQILPPSSGYFFGGTAYDEWYFDGVEETVDILESVLKYTNFEEEEIAYFEWW